jgi:hypothetical protein
MESLYLANDSLGEYVSGGSKQIDYVVKSMKEEAISSRIREERRRNILVGLPHRKLMQTNPTACNKHGKTAQHYTHAVKAKDRLHISQSDVAL